MVRPHERIFEGEGGPDGGKTPMNHRPLSELVALRIEDMRQALRLTQGAVAEGCGLERTNYVHKVRQTHGREGWSIDQAERVANYFRRYTGRKLVGWPFVDEKTSDMLEHVVSLMDSQGRR